MNRSTERYFAATLFVTILLFACNAGAQSNNRTYGQWTVGVQNNNAGFYASTVNDSGLAFGEYCNFKSKSCFWLVAADSACDNGHKYPTLGNTDQGAAGLV